MPNIKSAKKRVKIIDKKTAQNRATKKAYKEAIKAFEAAVEGNAKDKQDLYAKAVSMVDKALSSAIFISNEYSSFLLDN